MSDAFSNSFLAALQAPKASPAPAETQARIKTLDGTDVWGRTAITRPIQVGKPVVAVSLGPDDESGGVLLTGSEFYPAGERVGARVPFLGVAGAERMLATSIAGVQLPVGYDHKMQLTLWHVMPPRFPPRAELRRAGTLSATSGTPGEVVIPTMGRKRVRVAFAAPSVEAGVSIAGEVIGPSGAIISVPFYAEAGQTLKGAYEFSAQNPPIAATAEGDSKGWSVPDFVRLTLTYAGGNVTCAYAVTAWDE